MHAAKIRWVESQKTIQELLESLERVKMHLLLAISTDNVRLSHMIQSNLKAVGSNVHDIQTRVHSIEQESAAILAHQKGSETLTAQQRSIFESLSILRQNSSYESPEELTQFELGVGDLLLHPELQRWREQGGTLLLEGGPTSGKTVICKVLKAYLQKSYASCNVFVTAVHLSHATSREHQSLQSILALVVESMLRDHPRFRKYYNKLMLTGEGPLLEDDSLRIIHRASQDFDKFYLILDGLDEWEAEIVTDIMTRLGRMRTPITIFASSRPRPEIRAMFSKVIHTILGDR